MVQIGQHEGSTVIWKIQFHCPGDIGKRTVAFVPIEQISLSAAPRRIGADELIDRIPSLLIL